MARARDALTYPLGRRESLPPQAAGVLRRTSDQTAPSRRRHATNAGHPRPIHRVARRPHSRPTGDAPAMAPTGLSPVLAVEVTAARASADSRAPQGVDR